MYIKITQEIVRQAKEGGRNNPSYKILQTLEWCNRLGNHLIHGDIEDLMDLCNTYKDVFPSLATLWTKDAEQGSIVNTLEWHLEFITDTNENPKTRKDEQNHTIYVNVKDGFDVYRECHLLAENLDDIYMYKFILDYYKRINGYEKVNITYYPLLGGGSTTKDVLENEIKLKKSLVLCIVDSDKHFLSDSIGETAKQVYEVAKKHNAFNSYLYILRNVSEVENLVPLCVYENYIQLNNDIELKKTFEEIIKIKDDKIDNLSFFDYKSGITVRRLMDNDHQNTSKNIALLVNPEYEVKIQEQGKEWEKLREEIEKITAFSPNDKKMIFDKCKKKDCVVKGFGKNILKNVLDSQQERDKLSVIEKKDLSPAQQQEYETIGRILYNWACASSPIRL